MERLATLMYELFSLSISEGAISNTLGRARAPLLAAAATIQAVVLASPVVCSDETSARVKGKNWWEVRQTPLGTSVRFAARWVFVGTLSVCTSSNPAAARPWCGRCSATSSRASGCPTCWAASAATGCCGKCVWRTCCAMQNTLSSAAIPPSARHSGGCYCAPSQSDDSETR
ncbi:MAG: IS66 family transposase [Acetobacteraceae bacterium]|jgi:hypothetical protein